MSELNEKFDKVWTGVGTFRVAREIGMISLKADAVDVVIPSEQLCCAESYGCPHDREKIMQYYKEALESEGLSYDEELEWQELNFALRKIHLTPNQVQIDLPCDNYQIDIDMSKFLD